MSILERVGDPTQTVEFTVEGRGLLLGTIVLAGATYWAAFGSGPTRLLTAVVVVAIIISMLRDVRWSPLFAGPLLTVSPTSIAGRGDWLKPGWTLAWDQVDHFAWGRYGLFVHRAGAADWQEPLRQGGLGGPLLVAALSARLAAYRQLCSELRPLSRS